MTTTVEEELVAHQATVEAPVFVGAVTQPIAWMRPNYHGEPGSVAMGPCDFREGWRRPSDTTGWLPLYARVTADAPSTLGAGVSLEPHTAVEAPVGFTGAVCRNCDVVVAPLADVDAKLMSIRLYAIPTTTDEHSGTVIDAANLTLALSSERNRLREALEEIAKVEGTCIFSTDPAYRSGSADAYLSCAAIAREALGAKQP